tara:strand:+ start:822 stop:1520 length:699 start_codon:yes stop_codon:yes gene_type:complete
MNVLITGHTSGLGLSLTEKFLSKGYSVYGISRTTNKLLDKTNQLKCDLSNPEGINRASCWVKNLKIDILIHSAGTNKINKIENNELNDYSTALNLHVLSISQIFKGVLPYMVSNGGKLILISSIWSKIAAEGRGTYSIAKAALNAFARQVAVEYGNKSIYSISLILGFIKTPLTEKTARDPRIESAKQRALKCSNSFLDSDEAAEFIFTLSINSFKYLNGVSIDFDGGVISQ